MQKSFRCTPAGFGRKSEFCPTVALCVSLKIRAIKGTKSSDISNGVSLSSEKKLNFFLVVTLSKENLQPYPNSCTGSFRGSELLEITN